MTLIETIDRIRELRAAADHAEDTDYDPQGHAEQEAATLRSEAKRMEFDMHLRIGWTS